MAKGTGLIGNFKGKVGNTVGYKLAASNNGQTQGIRVYQPIVKNPKTAAQAEQRAKLAPINATYRALKMVIDRGNEALPYGNKSRLAWLKSAFKAEHMPWIEKGVAPAYPVACQLTKGSLSGLIFQRVSDTISINCSGVTTSTDVSTVGKLSTALMAAYPFLKAGDQITIVFVTPLGDTMNTVVTSFILDATSAVAQSLLEASDDAVYSDQVGENSFATVIVSREGDNGEHLRSNSVLIGTAATYAAAPYDATSKAAAIESYQSSAASNSDWAEESIQ